MYMKWKFLQIQIFIPCRFFYDLWIGDDNESELMLSDVIPNWMTSVWDLIRVQIIKP